MKIAHTQLNRRNLLWSSAACVAMAFALLLGSAAIAEDEPPRAGAPAYDLSWHTVDGGGGTSTGGGYVLSGTIGQHDAGVMSAGDYTLAGGFWAGSPGVEPKCPVFADLNCDGVVNLQDLIILINNWGPCPDNLPGCLGDLNNDGAVGLQDLIMLINNWG